MRLLFVHADHLEFEATTKAGEGSGETEGVPMSGRMEDCVTAFATVESGDEADLGAVVENAAVELRDVADQLNTRKVVLYPCVNLSDDLADPESAKTVLRDLEAALEGEYEVLRAPVGWYKAFELSCKGHPFSELSRRVTPEREGEDGANSGRASSEWKLLFPDAEVRNPRDVLDAEATLDTEEPDHVSADLRALVEAEVEGKTASEGERPPHADLLREKGFADDDPGDAGNLRWYPRGKLLRDSLTAYVADLAVEYGAMPVETCSDHFPIVRDANLRERDLPLRLYETPEMHTACADLERAREELRAQARLALRSGEDLGLSYVPTIRVTRGFYEDGEAWIERLVEDFDSPALLEIRSERRHDWAAKVDFATIDRLGRPIENATIRIDVASAERFDVEVDDEDRYYPPVLHFSLLGSVERAVAALLEEAAKRATPRLPTWLSPTQVRFLPVGDEHVEYCDALVADLESAGIRADVDDRDETVGERISRAETDWVPYYAVVGDRELESEGDRLGANVRAEADERELTLAALREAVLDDAGDLPKKPRYLPKRVSKHPHFTGR